jgi:hypothetical protein
VSIVGASESRGHDLTGGPLSGDSYILLPNILSLSPNISQVNRTVTTTRLSTCLQVISDPGSKLLHMSSHVGDAGLNSPS